MAALATKQLARKSTKTDFQKQEATAATATAAADRHQPLESTSCSCSSLPSCSPPLGMYPHIDFVRGARKRFWDLRNKSLVPQRANLQPQWQTANQSTHTHTQAHTLTDIAPTYTHPTQQRVSANKRRVCGSPRLVGYARLWLLRLVYPTTGGRAEEGGEGAQTDMALQGSLVFGHHL